ncbi:MAG: DUF1080 domain-containing protein [Planctomycetota bacterium]
MYPSIARLLIAATVLTISCNALAEENAAKKHSESGTEKVDPKKFPKLSKIGYTNNQQLPGMPWRIHDRNRPRPDAVQPGSVFRGGAADSKDPNYFSTAPSDAIVLFDGTNMKQWSHHKGDDLYPAAWNLNDGYMEVKRGAGSVHTIESFDSVQLHLQFQTPPVKGSSQGRGNSGIKFYGLYEVQVLDSFNNPTYADGQAGAIYGQHPPLVNPSLPSQQWQTYDIIFNAPKFDLEGTLRRPASMTVLHNGVVVQNQTQLIGICRAGRVLDYPAHSPSGHIMLQDHGNPIRYRDIWVRRL